MAPIRQFHDNLNREARIIIIIIPVACTGHPSDLAGIMLARLIHTVLASLADG